LITTIGSGIFVTKLFEKHIKQVQKENRNENCQQIAKFSNGRIMFGTDG